ncbi:anacyclamide/piricyclamide family prenylated cyclic peptide [Kamptonema formosum]|uniref:anacyclamide/piricyclamide family prenylated cyclic peptide n=1 Tax=Kamptonema formosum TaxID=331992 RepID=UPI0009E5607F
MQENSKKNKTFLPKQAAPVARLSPATAGTGAAGIVASAYCDLETKECFPLANPFAGDDAE